LLRMASSLVRQAGLNARWPYLVPPRTVAARCCGWVKL
jgi:hypothetical protein